MDQQVAILERNIDYSDYTDLTVIQDGGVLKKVIREGTGSESVLYGDQVFVDFVGQFEENGELFDSSREKGKQFSFQFGTGEVIAGWDICISTMKKGEICSLFCRSDYGYGKKANLPTVPPNTNLLFEIELHDWCGEDISPTKDKGIIRRILQTGHGEDNPNKGGSVTISLKGRVNGVFFDEREEIQFRLTEGSNHNLPLGIEMALESFRKGELSMLFLSPKYMKGTTNHEMFIGKDFNGSVEYEVHLHNFERVKENWELDTIQRINAAKVYRKEGNNFFNASKYDIAVEKYKQMLDYVQYTEASRSNRTDFSEDEVVELQLSGRLNLSMCHLKLGNHVLGKKFAEEAIVYDPTNVKAYFRLGLALLKWGEAEQALEAFNKCLEIEPNNKAAQKQVSVCTKEIDKLKLKERSIYGCMFEKFAENDAKKLALLNKRDVMAEDLGEWGQGECLEVIDTSQDDLKEVDMIYI